jgi:hypothetical protein
MAAFLNLLSQGAQAMQTPWKSPAEMEKEAASTYLMQQQAEAQKQQAAAHALEQSKVRQEMEQQKADQAEWAKIYGPGITYGTHQDLANAVMRSGMSTKAKNDVMQQLNDFIQATSKANEVQLKQDQDLRQQQLAALGSISTLPPQQQQQAIDTLRATQPGLKLGNHVTADTLNSVVHALDTEFKFAEAQNKRQKAEDEAAAAAAAANQAPVVLAEKQAQTSKAQIANAIPLLASLPSSGANPDTQAQYKQILESAPDLKKVLSSVYVPVQVKKYLADQQALTMKPSAEQQQLVQVNSDRATQGLPPYTTEQWLRVKAQMNKTGEGLGRQLPATSVSKISELDTAIDDATNLATKLATAPETGFFSNVGAMLPNWVTEATGIGEEAKGKQALINLAKQILGKSLEGGVLRKEDEEKYAKILPTISDPPNVAKEKIGFLIEELKKRKDTVLEGYESGGFNVSGFRQPTTRVPVIASQDAYNKLPKGAHYLAPDGSEKVKQ